MNKLGMTKIEVLVVAMIVGLLGVMAVIAISSARSSARDAVRLSDVRQVQTGLELYFNDVNQYPEQVEPLPLGLPSSFCLSEDGFSATCISANETVYLDVVGSPPTAGLGKDSSCGGVNNAYCYSAKDDVYFIQFELENRNPLLQLQKGVNCATMSGMDPGPCPVIETPEETEDAQAELPSDL